MDNLNDLKATWLSADTGSLPDVKMMTHIIKSFRNHKIKRKVLIIVLSVVLGLFFISMMFLGTPRMFTTLIGEGLFVLCLLLLAYTNIRSIKRFYEFNADSNRGYLRFLEQTRKNQIYYYKRTQVLGMVLYSLALPFYLFEFVYRYTALAIVFYIFLTAMLIFFWAVARPRAYRKEASKLQKLMEQTELIANQLK